MNSLAAHLRSSLVATAVLTTVCCGLYPAAVWGVAQIAFPDKANGSLLTDNDGTVRGSALIAQNFTGAKYFHPRPSAAGANGYDATSSGGSNYGPTSQKLADVIKERIAAYRADNGLKDWDPVPADAVTASASGLDPHISPRNAELQAARVAKARGLAADVLQTWIQGATDKPMAAILGDAGVNVLLLNRALDRAGR